MTVEVFAANAHRLSALGDIYQDAPDRENGKLLLKALSDVCCLANTQVFELGKARGQVGTSTTLVACVIAGNAAFIAHIGDSRLYLHREGDLVPLTTDHSVVAEMVSQGMITTEQARKHRWRNLITQAVGSQPTCTPEVRVVKLQPGDRLLLATDGLTDMVDEPTIQEIVADTELARATRKLVSAALANGGRDNVTVAVIEPELPRHVDGQKKLREGHAA